MTKENAELLPRFYRLTTAGRKRLREEVDGWERLAAAMAAVLAARPKEA